MYNSTLKETYIAQQYDNIKTIQNVKRVFDATEVYEAKYNCDISQMNDDQADETIRGVCGIKSATIDATLAYIRMYIRWRSDVCKDATTDAFFKVVTPSIEIIKSRSVSGPVDLSIYLDTIFDSKAEDHKPDNVYRCYMWLAFMGFEENESHEMTVKNVDLQTMEVNFNGRCVPIYREAFPVFRNVVLLDHFIYENSNYGDSIIRERLPGESLFRGVRSSCPTVLTLRAEINRQIDNTVSRLGDGVRRVTYARALQSGIFYRFYELERAGIEIDFKKFCEGADRPHRDKPVKDRKTLNNFVRDMKKDYEAWKLAFV